MIEDLGCFATRLAAWVMPQEVPAKLAPLIRVIELTSLCGLRVRSSDRPHVEARWVMSSSHGLGCMVVILLSDSLGKDDLPPGTNEVTLFDSCPIVSDGVFKGCIPIDILIAILKAFVLEDFEMLI